VANYKYLPLNRIIDSNKQKPELSVYSKRSSGFMPSDLAIDWILTTCFGAVIFVFQTLTKAVAHTHILCPVVPAGGAAD